MLEYTLGKISNFFNISFHFIKGKIGVYLWKQMQCTYVPKNTNIYLKNYLNDFLFYEGWRLIELCHFII
jgi:hypothetical protein